MVLHELWYLSDQQNEDLSLSVQEDTLCTSQEDTCTSQEDTGTSQEDPCTSQEDTCTSQENIETNDIKEEMPQVKYNKEEEMKKCLTMLKNHSKSKHLTALVPDSKRQRRYKWINLYSCTCNLIFEKGYFPANFDQC